MLKGLEYFLYEILHKIQVELSDNFAIINNNMFYNSIFQNYYEISQNTKKPFTCFNKRVMHQPGINVSHIIHVAWTYFGHWQIRSIEWFLFSHTHYGSIYESIEQCTSHIKAYTWYNNYILNEKNRHVQISELSNLIHPTVRLRIGFKINFKHRIWYRIYKSDSLYSEYAEIMQSMCIRMLFINKLN